MEKVLLASDVLRVAPLSINRMVLTPALQADAGTADRQVIRLLSIVNIISLLDFPDSFENLLSSMVTLWQSDWCDWCD